MPLLIHSDAVPAEARARLQAGSLGPPEQREEELEVAARVLYRETDLECGEVRDLVGLPSSAGCE
ncbi:MAG TPA: hypothetical protein VGP93_06305 [Polyangiaceae bacterium]|nr:hypothetical protein [Polyangiaceae bacterium]